MEFAKNMQQIDSDLRRLGFTEILATWGDMALAEILQRVPVGGEDSKHPGQLRDSMKTFEPVIWSAGDGGSINVGTEAEAFQGDVFYASMVEYGHGVGKRSQRVRATPIQDYRYDAMGNQWHFGRSSGPMFDIGGKEASMPEDRARQSVTAHPYMRPAMEAMKPKMMPVAARIVDKIMASASRGIAA